MSFVLSFSCDLPNTTGIVISHGQVGADNRFLLALTLRTCRKFGSSSFFAVVSALGHQRLQVHSQLYREHAVFSATLRADIHVKEQFLACDATESIRVDPYAQF